MINNDIDMKKIKKVTRRSFTEKQLDMLEQYHYQKITHNFSLSL